jgi:hypothetical protein
VSDPRDFDKRQQEPVEAEEERERLQADRDNFAARNISMTDVCEDPYVSYLRRLRNALECNQRLDNDEDTDIDEERECGRPCDPQNVCNECAVYWERMRREGYWVDKKGWTNKAVREWVK